MFVIYQEHGSTSVFQSENNLLILTGGGGGGGSHPDADIRRGPGLQKITRSKFKSKLRRC